MNALYELCANLLAFFFSIGGHNYVVAITLLTLTIMLMMLPLTLKGTRSMLAMQKLAPDLKRLQEEHKNDRQRLTQEMQALYRDNKIHPLSGCLPMLLQAPVFFILYKVLLGLVHHTDGKPTPMYISKSSELYHAVINGQGKLESFGIDFATTVIKALKISIWSALPLFIVIVLMVLAQFWNQRQIMSRAPSSDDPQAQMMYKMQKLFPYLSGAIALTLPGGVVFYWFVSSVLRVVQQAAMYRFDPVLKTTVESAHKEAGRFLAEGKRAGRAQQPGARPGQAKTNKQSKKKRKGR